MCEFSIIIVTYNSERDIIPCIESIVQQSAVESLEIIIVDNNSADKTNLLIDNISLPHLTVIRSPLNLGFSKACNLGASRSKGRFLYFCNPDSILLNDIFSLAKHHLYQQNVGCVSPQILRSDGSEAAFAFCFPHSPFTLIKAFLRDLVGHNNAYILQLNHFTETTIIECDWILGAGMFVRRDVFMEVGGFDESYFLYFEDIDICKRIKQAGYKILADRNLLIKHKYFGSSSSLIKSEVMAIRIQSQLNYYKKHHGTLGYFLAKYLDPTGFLFRA